MWILVLALDLVGLAVLLHGLAYLLVALRAGKAVDAPTRESIEEPVTIVAVGLRLWSLVAAGTQVLVTGERLRNRHETFDATVIRLEWSSGRRLTVRERTTPLARPTSGPIQLPPDSFSARYAVWARRARSVQRGLRSGSRAALLRIASWRPVVEVYPEFITVHFVGLRHPGPEVPGAIGEVLAFAAGLGADRRIEWTDDIAPTGVCATCFAGVEDDVRTCLRCRATQHADCWTYVGGCSAYACRGVDSES